MSKLELYRVIESELGQDVAQILLDNEIDAEAFVECDTQDFKDIGVKLGIAKKLVKLANQFKSGASLEQKDSDVGGADFPVFQPQSRPETKIITDKQMQEIDQSVENMMKSTEPEVIRKYKESIRLDPVVVEVPKKPDPVVVEVPKKPDPVVVEVSSSERKKTFNEDAKTLLQNTFATITTHPKSPAEKIITENLLDMSDHRTYVLSYYFTKEHFPPPSHLVRKFPLLTRTEAQDVVKAVIDELSSLKDPRKFVLGDKEYMTHGSYNDNTMQVRGYQRAEERSDPNRFERRDTNHFISAKELLEHQPCWFDPTANTRELVTASHDDKHPTRQSERLQQKMRNATDATKDPLDTVYFPRANFNGIERFDGDHGHINDSQVDPRNMYAKMSMLQDDIVMTGEVVAVMPSDGGKFRTLLFNDDLHNNTMTLGHIERVVNNLTEYTRDRKTLGVGMCSRNKRELCGSYDYKGLWNAHFSGIHGYGTTYYESLYSAVHQVMYHPKPTFVMMSGALEGPSAGLAMHAECRMAHAGTRLSFNQCQRGSTLDCGSTWRLTNMGAGNALNNSDLEPLSFYLALTGRPLTMWDMMELNFCDWAWPHENGPFTMSAIGQQIDFKMRDIFWEQDKYHVRTNFKSIVELQDRGLEFFRSPLLAGEKGAEVQDLMQGFDRDLERKSVTKTSATCQRVVNALVKLQINLESKSKVSYEAAKMLEGLEKSSPLSLLCTTLLLMKSWHLQEVRSKGNQSSHNTTEKNDVESFMNDYVYKSVQERTDPLPTTFLKMEYRMINWLMERGDFWEGVQAQAFPKDGPAQFGRKTNFQTATLPKLKAFLETPEGMKLTQEISELMKYPDDMKSQTKDPADSLPRLQLPHVPLRDTMVHPEFTLPGLTWKGTDHYDDQLRKQMIWNYDFAMLRGSAHPDMDLILQRRKSSWRKDLMNQGRTVFQDMMSQKAESKSLSF